MPSFFWAPLLAGRGLAPLILKRTPEVKVISNGLVLAALGVLVLVTAKVMSQVGSGACLAGLGLSTIFPISVSILSQMFGLGTSRVAALVFTLAGLGGEALPWLVGIVSTSFGNLQFGLMVPLASCLSVLFLHHRLAQRRWIEREVPSAS